MFKPLRVLKFDFVPSRMTFWSFLSVTVCVVRLYMISFEISLKSSFKRISGLCVLFRLRFSRFCASLRCISQRQLAHNITRIFLCQQEIFNFFRVFFVHYIVWLIGCEKYNYEGRPLRASHSRGRRMNSQSGLLPYLVEAVAR